MQGNKRRTGIVRLLLTNILLLLVWPASANPGKKYMIYYGNNSTPTEQAVCADLKEDLEKVTGATVIIAPETNQLKAADYNFLVATPATSQLLAGLVKKGIVQQKELSAQGGIIKVVRDNAAQIVLLTGATAEGMQNTVYAYSRSVLGIDPLHYWTGRKPDKKENFDPYKTQDRVIASPVVPIICYMENDVDELANLHKPYLEYDMDTWKGMVNSLRRTHYNAIHLFDMLGRPEFYTRAPYKKLRPDYQVNLPLVDSMITYAHLKGMKIQVDLSLGYQMKSISDSEALCWTENKDKWIATWVYYLTKTPLARADIYSLRPRNQVWDRAYVSSCGEDRVKIFNEIFAAVDSVLNVYRPGVTKVCVCYDDGMELFNSGFQPPKDFIIGWSDDGYCNFKTMPVSNKGYSFGTYMHAGFWTNHTVHDPYPVKIDSVMSYMLKHYNASSYLKVNGQTFRPFLLNLEAFSQWAYDPSHFNGEEFYKRWTSYNFGPKAAPFAIASMKKLDDAQFNRTGYVRNLSEIKNIIGFLSDRAVETPNGSFVASYDMIQVPDLQRRYREVNAAYNAALSGLPAAQHADFYHDYVYLPSLMYNQLLELESTLLAAADRKQAYATGHQKKDIDEAKKLVKKSFRQLEAINNTCQQGDKDAKWKTWYDPAKRRPNNGFPTPDMITAIQRNLQQLSVQ
ncbi:glycosyl hydrolase 115 family protein [Chitinophaga sp. MM2321]|uniref:glycosyl hydrolase 115 family protein n=1 Tax=Chitinophaga sp. MM2321 TaxID=3137178 RepID=UPI0032D5AD4C